MERAEDPQADALRAFTTLCLLRPDWRGTLVVVCGLGPGGRAVSLAANIAGAGCLAIEEHPEVCRAALRSGACDFVVNSVDEGLRVLKNEIRQLRPVSVGLTLAPDVALKELLDRGVLPELVSALPAGGRPTGESIFGFPMPHRAIEEFAAVGSLVVDFDRSFSTRPGVIDASVRLDSFTRAHGLLMESFSFVSADDLRHLDVRLLALVPLWDTRHRWCAAAPRFFHRERPYRRTVFLTREENSALRSV